MQVVESIGCEKGIMWFGPCFDTHECDNKCINLEHAIHGACHMDWFGPVCYCYFCWYRISIVVIDSINWKIIKDMVFVIKLEIYKMYEYIFYWSFYQSINHFGV